MPPATSPWGCSVRVVAVTRRMGYEKVSAVVKETSRRNEGSAREESASVMRVATVMMRVARSAAFSVPMMEMSL